MTVRVRFAPSPTGFLHVGNITRAVQNWLFAHKAGGVFMLRLDDTDNERSTEEFANGIQEDLKWLGLDWTEFARQSDRMDRYQWAFETLKAAGRLYPCYESPEELELKRKILLGRGKPPIYDRAALQLTDAQKADFEAKGIAPHWRFLLNHEEITWDDLGRGTVKFHGANLSDPVLFRSDMRPIYSLSSVVDDIDFAITHVIRGEDHVTNTAYQVQICDALGHKSPIYAHLQTLVGAEGQKLSKRLGALSIRDLRAEGMEPMAINNLIAALGTPDSAKAYLDLEDLAAAFDLKNYGRASPKFDPNELAHINAKLMNAMPYEMAAPKLAAIGMDQVDEEFWLAVRENLTFLKDIKVWWQICRDKVAPVIENADLTGRAAELLPKEPWDNTTWQTLTKSLQEKTGLKGKALFMPLRLALTGREDGPDLATVIHLIGYDRVKARFEGQTA